MQLSDPVLASNILEPMNINNFALILTSLAPFVFGFAKAQSAADEELRRSMSFPIDDIMKAKAMVDKYTPEGQLYLVDEPGQAWLKRAVSMSRREDWIKDVNYWAGYGPETPDKKRVLYAAFDELKKSAEKKLPNYLPSDKCFAFTDAEDIKLIKAALSDTDKGKIYKIGTSQNQWTVVPGSNNIPINRFKKGYMWIQYPESISGLTYPSLFHINIIQNYEGGGTYGAAYGKFIYSELVGPPKK
jgi:hypothetical protein